MPDSGNTTQTRRVIVQVSANGGQDLKNLTAQFGNMNKNVRDLNNSFGGFRNIFQSILGFSVAGVGLKTLTDTADAMQNLRSRLGILSGSSEEAQRTFEGLFNAANETKTSVEALGTVYTRISQSTKELGLNSRDTLQFTKLLQNTFRLSGATIAEATNATIQLSQGFASGQLRGQELRSVLEQNVVIGDILTKSLGKTRGELYKLAEAGKLTSGTVLTALAKSQDEVNAKAEKLGQTFEQTLTISINKFKIKIDEINREFGLSGKFATGIEFLIANVEKLALVITVLLVPALGIKLVSAVKALSIAILSSPISPWVLALQAASIAVIALSDNMGGLKKNFTSLDGLFGRFLATLSEFGNKNRLNGLVELVDPDQVKALNAGVDKVKELSQLEDLRKRNAAITDMRIKDRNALNTRDGLTFKSKRPEEEELEKRSDLLEKLNKQYEKGAVSLSEYYEQLEKINSAGARRQFLKGKIDVQQYNEQIRKFKTFEINKAFQEGEISVTELNKAIENNQLDTLNEKFKSGKINIKEYDEELIKLSSRFEGNSAFRTGINDYLESIGTLSQGIAGSVTRTFGKLEDSLVEFTKTGKFNFNDFAQSILDDLNRIIIRSTVIAPLAKGLLNTDFTSLFSFGSSSGASLGSTSLGSIATPFASGGVVSGATPFSYGGGKLGVMGEAGHEAILPLARTPSGDLGVQASSAPVYINIVNNTSGTVEQKESIGPDGSRQIDILINGKVKEAIANGHFDKTFQSAYGLQRKGN